MSRWKLSSLPAPTKVSTGTVSRPNSTGGWRVGSPGANTRNIVATKGSLTVGAGNGAVTVAADTAGVASNDIRFRIVVAGASTALSVSVSGNDITVNSATNGSSAATSTAAQIAAAIQASGPASALVDATAGGDGSGIPTATTTTLTNLTGGADRKFGT
jgi:hypothetical protein